MNIDLDQLKRSASFLRESEKKINQTLLGIESNWVAYDNGWENGKYPYQKTFFDVIPPNQKFRDYLISCALNDRDKLTAVDLGGSGSALFKDLDIFSKSLGVCLRDIRDLKLKIEDRDRNHDVLEANYLSSATYSEIVERLGSKPFFVVSRVVGALEDLPNDRLNLLRIFEKIYLMLSENGIMLIQYDDPTNSLRYLPIEDIEEFLKRLADNNKQGLEIKIGKYGFFLKKNQSAPKTTFIKA